MRDSDVTSRAGVRRSQPFAGDPQGIGWRAWVGPLLVARTRGTRLGVSVGWSRG